MPETTRNGAAGLRQLLIAVLLVSAAALGYEILLMRMLSIVQWHHFAWMVISLALLGYGASGTAIALARGLADAVGEDTPVDVALCPPNVYLSDVAEVVAGTPVGLGAQNLYAAAGSAENLILVGFKADSLKK